jgi:signal transduction histidine kinase
MSPHRPSLLLVLLVAMPLALLVWLGTYLHADGERRARTTREAIVTERLEVASQQLLADLKLAVRQLDQAAVVTAEVTQNCVLGDHPWIRAALCQSPGGEPMLAGDEAAIGVLKGPMLAFQRGFGKKSKSSPVGKRDRDFELVSAGLQQGWKGYLLGPMLASVTDTRLPGQDESGLIVRVVGDGLPEVIHWHLLRDGRMLGALLDSQRFFGALFETMPPVALKTLTGRMSLVSDSGKTLHGWGNPAAKGREEEVATLACPLPFQSWQLQYEPAQDEFPSAALFPILLGVSSGSLLVPSLALLYFRENSREIRVAQQRVSFVNQVSHELKTPLTNIRLYAEMARGRAEERDDVASVRQLAVVESETARLSRLIQNVLNFANKKRDCLTVTEKSVDLAAVIGRLADQWKPVLDKRGIAVEVSVPERLEVQTDPDAVEQILGNLLSNAEKYAVDGHWVGIEAMALEGDRVTVAVADHGPGIPVSKQEAVFEPFERLRSDLREGVSGTGIGLTISRELAGLLGGSLFVDATYREGSRFVLSLPITPAAKTA